MAVIYIQCSEGGEEMKYTFYASTGYVNSMREEEIDIPDEELEGLSDLEKDEYIRENYFNDWLVNHVDQGFYEKRDK